MRTTLLSDAAASGAAAQGFARRGLSPEQPYGKLNVGPAYDPSRHDRLLVPTTGDAYPNWTFEHFLRVVADELTLMVLQ